MGSCISKFGPKREKIKKQCCKNCSNVHDKLVIAEAPISATPPLIEKPVSYMQSVASNGSSSFTNSTTCTEFSITSSLSSSASCSSSISISKDRSFSNEFLRACANKNPHIMGRNSVKGTHENSRIHSKVHGRHPFDYMPSPEKPHLEPVKKTYEERRGGGSTPKKRTRANSPTIIRQKSFRKDPEIENSMYNYHVPGRNLRSPPSPRRIFNEEQSLKDSSKKASIEDYNKRGVISKSKANLHNAQSSSLKKQSYRVSPVRQMKTTRGPFNYPQVSSKIDECEGEDEEEDEEMQNQTDMMVEDMNNPLIALDCFIFL